MTKLLTLCLLLAGCSHKLDRMGPVATMDIYSTEEGFLIITDHNGSNLAFRVNVTPTTTYHELDSRKLD